MTKLAFVDRNVATIKRNKALWAAHAAANKPRIKHQVSELWKDENTKTGVLVAAGPSLADSLGEIRALDRDRYELVAVDMAARFLLKNGIRPDYVIVADASEAINKALDLSEFFKSDEDWPALLASTVIHPETARDWKGPVYWYNLMSAVYDGDSGQWMQDEHKVGSGVSTFLTPGGNVSSLGLSFLTSVRECRQVRLYGSDFCWKPEGPFYCGGDASELASERIAEEEKAGTIRRVKNTRGEDVLTNGSLCSFAQWFLDVAAAFPGLMDNRSPSTILPHGGGN